MIAGIGEFLLGNTFPFTVFMSYGAWFITFGVTLQPFYEASSSYEATGGANSPEFLASFGKLSAAYRMLKISETDLIRVSDNIHGIAQLRLLDRVLPNERGIRYSLHCCDHGLRLCIWIPVPVCRRQCCPWS